MRKIAYLILIAGLTSCVSARKYKDATGKLQNCENENSVMNQKNQALTVSVNELESKLKKSQADAASLDEKLKETEALRAALDRAGKRLEEANTDLEKQLESLKKGSSEEINKLLDQLQSTQADIQQREEQLRKTESELSAKNARLSELQDALDKKDEMVRQLKEKVVNALVGFNNNGLSINERNGKVYVSMEERLLFKTGDWNVDVKGKQALKDLAEVLAQNPEINVMVEGHTDDVPMRGTGQVKDNWDLSVMRATAVTKILLENKLIDPQRITSAGRGEFFPLATGKTPEDRQKNRRTEIILSPRMDEIFKLFDIH